MNPTLTFAVIVTLVLSGIFFWWQLTKSQHQHRVSRNRPYGLGDIVYRDSRDAVSLQARYTLPGRNIWLQGKPDFILRNDQQELIVVELKSGRRPEKMRKGERLQLASYMFLVEQEYQERPARGYLKYLDEPGEPHYLDNQERLQHELKGALNEMYEVISSRCSPLPKRNDYCGVCPIRSSCNLR